MGFNQSLAVFGKFDLDEYGEQGCRRIDGS